MALSAVREDGLFLTQVAFSALAMGFSIAMLLRGEDPSIYLPVLTGTLGYWTPNPQSVCAARKSTDRLLTMMREQSAPTISVGADEPSPPSPLLPALDAAPSSATAGTTIAERQLPRLPVSSHAATGDSDV